MALEITPFYEPDSGTWTYLLADSLSNAAVIIDPVWVYNPVSGATDDTFIDGILDFATQNDWRIEWVLETHAHADHITASGEIRRRTGARIACGKGICDVQQTFSRAFNMPGLATDGRQFDRLLSDGDRISMGQLEIKVMETPGHTNDSLCYLVEDAAFIGDTLFAPSFGSARCDFPGGSAGQLFDSVSLIYQLPDETRLFLCHDYPKSGLDPVSCVTLAESRRANIHINAATKRESFVAMREARDAQLSLPRLIMPALQLNIAAGAPPAAEDNGVVYLRTPFNRALAELVPPAPQNEQLGLSD